MWIKDKNSEYFLTFNQDNGYELCVTDFISVWTTFYSDKALVAQLKESNEGLELANDNEFLQKGLYMFTNLDKLKKLSITKLNYGKYIFLTMRIIIGYPFCFDCELKKGSDEFYFEKVTQPLLKTISDLRSSQSTLRHELKEKDKAIDEYKSEGGEIVLKHLKTDPFNDEAHMSQYKKYEEIFGTADIPLILIDKPIQSKSVSKEEAVPVPNIKQEPIPEFNIKQEPIPAITVRQETKDETQQNTPMITNNVIIKEERHTPVFEEQFPPFPNCKQELIKTEIQSSETGNNSRRKRMKKLNL